MEREESFEAIVAKAVFEVNRNQWLCLSSLKSPLALGNFIAALGSAAPRKITASQPHPQVDLVLGRVVGFVAGCPGPGGTDASPRKTPAPAKLGRGHRHPPRRRYQYFLITSSAEGTSIWTNDPTPTALRICWAQWVSLRAGNWRVLSVQLALIVVQVPEESPIETGILGGAENSLGAPCVTGLLVLEQTIFRDQDPAVAQSLRIRRQFFDCLESLCEALSHRLRVGAVNHRIVGRISEHVRIDLRHDRVDHSLSPF